MKKIVIKIDEETRQTISYMDNDIKIINLLQAVEKLIIDTAAAFETHNIPKEKWILDISNIINASLKRVSEEPLPEFNLCYGENDDEDNDTSAVALN